MQFILLHAPSSHESYLEMALKAGKPVYVEKPVTVNSASVQRMIEMEKKYDAKVSVAHYRRGLPLFNKIKQLVNDGAIGKVKLILLKTLQPTISKIITQTDDNWRINPEISGGGLFHDLSPHQLDIMYWIFGRRNKHMYRPLTRESCTMHPILQWCRSHLQTIFTLMAYGILMWRKRLRVIHVKLLETEEV